MRFQTPIGDHSRFFRRFFYDWHCFSVQVGKISPLRSKFCALSQPRPKRAYGPDCGKFLHDFCNFCMIHLFFQVEIRPMMYVALTYDHRLIDGREAVTFLKKIKQVVEDPRMMLLDL